MAPEVLRWLGLATGPNMSIKGMSDSEEAKENLINVILLEKDHWARLWGAHTSLGLNRGRIGASNLLTGLSSLFPDVEGETPNTQRLSLEKYRSLMTSMGLEDDTVSIVS